jgi:hypothetical protein
MINRNSYVNDGGGPMTVVTSKELNYIRTMNTQLNSPETKLEIVRIYMGAFYEKGIIPDTNRIVQDLEAINKFINGQDTP